MKSQNWKVKLQFVSLVILCFGCNAPLEPVTGSFSESSGSPLPEPTPQSKSDFTTRCAQPGVVICRGFDTDAELSPSSGPTSTGAEPNFNGSFQYIQIDKNQRASGTGSLRFEIVGNTPANHSGAFRQYLGRSFGEGSVFYVQYRLRVSETFVNNDWDAVNTPGAKIALFHHSSATCNDVEWSHYFASWHGNIPEMYHACSPPIHIDQPDGSILLQQGDHLCNYGTDYLTNPNCFKHPPEKWVTYYFKGTVGNWNQPNSHLEAWYSIDGKPYQKWIDAPNFTLMAEGASEPGFDSVYLTTYMTRKDSSVDHPTALAWYDELIVSTQPIAIPDTSEDSAPPASNMPPPPPSTNLVAPQWIANIQPGTWGEGGLNTISSVDPANDPGVNPNYPGQAPWDGNNGLSCVIDCWNGAAFATGLGPSGSYIAWGGGHKGYYGNEVYAFDMATQMWSRLSNPYTNIVFPQTDGIWPDGSPVVPHTYAMVGYHPGTNSFVSVQTEINNNGGVVAPVPVFFNLQSRTWRRAPRSPQHIQYGGFAVYDSSRDAWWMEGGDSGGYFAKFTMNGDGTAGSWQIFDPKYNALDAMAARDPVNDILTITRFNGNGPLSAVDLKNPAAQPVTLTMVNAPNREGRHGWEWSELRQAFIYWRRGTDVYEVKQSGPDWRTATWVWTRLNSAAPTVTPTDPTPGVYNRFRLVRYGNYEVGVVVNSVTGKTYAFRLP